MSKSSLLTNRRVILSPPTLTECEAIYGYGWWQIKIFCQTCVLLYVEVFADHVSTFCDDFFIWQTSHVMWQMSHLIGQTSHLKWQTPHLEWQTSRNIWQTSHPMWQTSHVIWQNTSLCMTNLMWQTSDRILGTVQVQVDSALYVDGYSGFLVIRNVRA